MNILLVEDHELFREGLKLLLADLGGGIVFCEAAGCAEALALAGTQSFDVVLLDLHLPGLSGLEALKAVRAAFEQAVIVALSAEDDPGLIRKVIDHGAAGFIPKASTHAVMIAALRLILAGATYLPSQALLAASDGPAGHNGSSLAHLTDRQMEALRCAMQGKANKVIARELNLSEATVKVHLSAAFRALGVRNRTEAVFAAARAGLSI